MFPITIAFGTLILLLVTVLAINTTRMRRGTPRDATPEQKEALRRAIRTHGNNFEHGVTVILLMMFYELSGANAATLCSIGVVYLATRLLYSYGYLSKPGSMPQIVSAGVTYLVEVTLIVLIGINLI